VPRATTNAQTTTNSPNLVSPNQVSPNQISPNGAIPSGGNLSNNYWQGHWNWFDNVYRPYYRNQGNNGGYRNYSVNPSQNGSTLNNPGSPQNNAFQNAPNGQSNGQFSTPNGEFQNGPQTNRGARSSGQYRGAFQNGFAGQGNSNGLFPPTSLFPNSRTAPNLGPAQFGTMDSSGFITNGRIINPGATGNRPTQYGWW